MGTISLSLQALQEISITDEERFEFMVYSDEGAVQLRCATGSTDFERWVRGFTYLAEQQQERRAAREAALAALTPAVGSTPSTIGTAASRPLPQQLSSARSMPPEIPFPSP